MTPKLIKLGVKTILKIICEKIIIRDILIVNKNDKIKGALDKLYIKAESIVFNKIYINNIFIKIKDIVLRFTFNKIFFIDNCHAVINMRLTKDNINKTLFSNKWRSLKSSIESFISMSFQGIEISNESIYFISFDELSYSKVAYTLHFDKNSISLVNNNNNKEKLSIFNDKNINVKNLIFCENYVELELSSKITIN
tara:strand:- start:287 stop:874 length:588 start_codon:yes stop_codon:yes gene_type:complete